MKGPHVKLKVLVQTVRGREAASRSLRLGLVGPDNAPARPAGENLGNNTGLGDERHDKPCLRYSHLHSVLVDYFCGLACMQRERCAESAHGAIQRPHSAKPAKW